MKTSSWIAFAASASLAAAFSTKAPIRTSSTLLSSVADRPEVPVVDRSSFLQGVLGTTAAIVTSSFLTTAEPAFARGRATLEQAVQKYAPRIRSGGAFYASDLKSMVAKNDWTGIKEALQEPPKRKKEDLVKSDSGVAARARQAGGFSDARVLVAGR